MRLALALAALLLSCADDAVWWDLPPDMTDDERSAFGEACERWNAVAIRQQYISGPEGGGTHRVFLVLPQHFVNQIDVNGDGVNDVSGEYQASSHTMHLRRGMSRDSVVLNVEHEAGHALGLHHIDGAGVMNAFASQIEFSEADLAECRRVNACR